MFCCCVVASPLDFLWLQVCIFIIIVEWKTILARKCQFGKWFRDVIIMTHTWIYTNALQGDHGKTLWKHGERKKLWGRYDSGHWQLYGGHLPGSGGGVWSLREAVQRFSILKFEKTFFCFQKSRTNDAYAWLGRNSVTNLLKHIICMVCGPNRKLFIV